MPVTHPLRLETAVSFAAPPAAVWPFVSDTNRMNRLAGLAPVRYDSRPLSDGRIQRVGRSRMGGVALAWDEHPFAWTYGERLAVERVFHGGPLEAYRSSVTLAPEGDGTRLVHALELTPRAGWLGSLVTWLTRRELDRWQTAYGMVDAYLRGAGPHPFDAPDAPPPGAQGLIAAGHPPARVTRLLALIHAGSDLDVQHIRPFALARRWDDDRDAVLGLCFEAARQGLLEPRWSHLCPRCRGPKGSVSQLAELAAEASCDDCGVTFAGAFDQAVELAFRPAPAVRRVEELVYCIAGPGATPHVVFSEPVAPGERRSFELLVEPGTYRLRGGWPDGGEAYVVYSADPEEPGALELDLGAPAEQVGSPLVGGPALALVVTNPTAAPRRVVVEREAWSEDVLTAAFASTLAPFRDVLGDQALAPGRAMPIGLLAFVTLRMHGGAELVRARGTRAAHDLLDGWSTCLKDAIWAGGGCVYDQVGDTLVATFYDPFAAARAAVAALAAAPPDPALEVSVGVDAGECMVQGPGLNYLGEPVQAALDLAAYAPPGQAAFSLAMAREPGVALWLASQAGCAVERDDAAGLVRLALA